MRHREEWALPLMLGQHEKVGAYALGKRGGRLRLPPPPPGSGLGDSGLVAGVGTSLGCRRAVAGDRGWGVGGTGCLPGVRTRPPSVGFGCVAPRLAAPPDTQPASSAPGLGNSREGSQHQQPSHRLPPMAGIGKGVYPSRVCHLVVDLSPDTCLSMLGMPAVRYLGLCRGCYRRDGGVTFPAVSVGVVPPGLFTSRETADDWLMSMSPATSF